MNRTLMSAFRGGIRLLNISTKTRLEKAALLSSIVVSICVLAGSIINLIRPIYFEAAIGLVSLIIFIGVQIFLNRGSWLRNPPVMQICISALVFLSVFIGRFFSLYKLVPGYDKSQHFLYGMAFCVCGLVLFYLLNPGQASRLTVSTSTIIWFAVGFSLICGFAWELFEFACDRLFDTNMQAWKQGLAHGLIDTMADLIIDLAGSVLVALFARQKLVRSPGAFYERYMAGFLPVRPAEADPAGGGK